MSIIQVQDLTLTYKSGKGIFDVSFTVQEGECFGYLGPNGAGKTTTIRQLMGFTNADHGNCRIAGRDTRKNAAEIQNTIGYLPEEMSFFPGMTGSKFLKFMQDMRKTGGNSRLQELVELFELNTDIKIRRMSKGMRQKVGLITAFMHDPDIYILDEPTSGLDPLMQRKFINLVLEEKKRGKTILLSSHRFDELELTADRAGIIRSGRLVTVEDINSLKASRQKTFRVTVKTENDLTRLQNSKLQISSVRDKQVEVVVSGNINQFIKLLAECDISGLDIISQDLEEVFMKYYGKEADFDEQNIT